MKAKYCMCKKNVDPDFNDKLPPGCYTIQLWTCGTKECEHAMDAWHKKNYEGYLHENK